MGRNECGSNAMVTGSELSDHRIAVFFLDKWCDLKGFTPAYKIRAEQTRAQQQTQIHQQAQKPVQQQINKQNNGRNIDAKLISFYRAPISNCKPEKEMSLREIHDFIKNGRSGIVIKLRGIKDEKEAIEIGKKNGVSQSTIKRWLTGSLAQYQKSLLSVQIL